MALLSLTRERKAMALLRPQLVRPRIALGAGLALLLATGLVFSSFSATSAQSPKSRVSERAAIESGSWEIVFTWAGAVNYNSSTLNAGTFYLGSGNGTMEVDADSVAGPYGIIMSAQGSAQATSASGATATGRIDDGSWTFSGQFGGSSRRACLTGSISFGGTLEYEDALGLSFIPLDGLSAPISCADWPLRTAIVRCNVIEGQWAAQKQAVLSTSGYRWSGSPSRFWGVRTPPSATASAAAREAIRSLNEEATALATAQPISATDLRAFLRAARSRLPQARSACGDRQIDVELQALTRVIIAQIVDQEVELSTDVLIELADFAARVDAFSRPQSALSRRTSNDLYLRFDALADNSTATGAQLADAADATRRLGWERLANRLDQEASLRA